MALEDYYRAIGAKGIDTQVAKKKTAAPPKERSQGFIERWNILPALGAILGGAGAGVAALPSGPGAIAAAAGGGAAGAAGGEALEQLLFRKKTMQEENI